MPRIRVTLTAIGLTIVLLSLLARVSEAQRDVRKSASNTGQAQPAASTASPAAEAAQTAETEEDAAALEARKALAEANAARVARMDLDELLQVPQIQEELKLTERQKAQLQGIETQMSQLQSQMRQQMRGGGGPGGRGRGADRQAEAIVDQQKEGLIAGILQPAQRTRLSQIKLQAEGPIAVTLPDVATQLRITPVQMHRIELIRQQMGMEQRQLDIARRVQTRAQRGQRDAGQAATSEGEGEGGNPSTPDAQGRSSSDPAREQSEKVKDRAIQEIAKVLTTGQRTSFNRMLGATYDFADLNLGRSGGEQARGGGRRGR